jgi:hypothetical protein
VNRDKDPSSGREDGVASLKENWETLSTQEPKKPFSVLSKDLSDRIKE